VDDVGYETARLKLVDVMGQICTMLRQRGMLITTILGHACTLAPISSVASAEDQTDSERAVLSALSLPTTNVTGSASGESIQTEIVAVIPEAVPGRSIASVHIQRGLAAVGDETWVYMFNAGKVGIKKCKLILDSLDEGEGGRRKPRRIVVVSREKMTNQAEEAIRSQGFILEKFLLNELSYNVTRHFLVPRHEMCTAEEIARLKKKYDKLALQSRDDAISRFYGMLPGDIILYRRIRLGSMGALYYREIH
jgi:DNA-directed RNA polymerase subunit H (RpoH/RPB5)